VVTVVVHERLAKVVSQTTILNRTECPSSIRQGGGPVEGGARDVERMALLPVDVRPRHIGE
jgi:hypothetical protein